MRIELTDAEIGLCIGAAELAAKELREGHAASERLKMPLPPTVLELAGQMDELRKKLLAVCGESPNADKPESQR